MAIFLKMTELGKVAAIEARWIKVTLKTVAKYILGSRWSQCAFRQIITEKNEIVKCVGGVCPHKTPHR